MEGLHTPAPQARGSLSRRSIVAAGWVALGLAARPGRAQPPLVVPVPDIVRDHAEVPTAGARIPTYWTRPPGTGPFPVVLVLGAHGDASARAEEICDRLARDGFMAVAPDLAFRAADPARADPARAGAVQADPVVMADLDVLADWAGQGRGDLGRLSVVGFGAGLRSTWMYAAHNPRLKAAVAWYGADAPSGAMPANLPLEVASRLKAPLLGLYGRAEAGAMLSQVRDAAARAQANGRTVQFVVQAEEQPADGWGRMTGWLRAHGAA